MLPCQGAVKHSTFAFGFPHLRAPNSRIRRHLSSSLFHFSQPASAYFNSPCFLIPAAKMDPPLAKKQKINPKKPITFKSAGMKPDIYFKVFDQEFHVTSMVLKLHSGFFRTFLDPAGGKLPKSTQPGFTSEWFTRIDDDGTWELSSDHQVCDKNIVRLLFSTMLIWNLQFRTMTLSEFKGSKDHEGLCFQKTPLCNPWTSMSARECR